MSDLTFWLLLIALGWISVNVLASYAPIFLAERISPGRLPAELLARGEARNVRFYVSTHNQFSYAFSAWAPPFWTVVVFDQAFFRRASPELVRFVVAHELGHAARRHHQLRWAVVVSLLVALPWVRRWLERQEDAADAYATELTGLKKEFFPQLKQAP